MGSESDEERQRRRPEPPPVEFVRSGEPATPIPPRDQPAAWVPRPEDYFRPTGPPPAPAGAPGWLHVAAALLLILAALVAIGWTVALSIQFPTPSEYENLTRDLTPAQWATGQVLVLISIWGQSIALLAGVMAYLRLHWRFAIGCSLLSVLAIGLLGLADVIVGGATVLGLVGVAVLWLARREFAS
jgi:hypothetical protein